MKDNFIELLKSNQEHVENLEGIEDVQDGQNPGFVTVCCSDSRVLQDHMWDNETPGEIFTVSNIGNRVYQEKEGEKFVSGDMIYPVAHADTDTMIVVGHTGCGAVTVTYHHLKGELDYENEPEGIQKSVDALKPIIEEGMNKLPENLEEDEAVNHLVEFNVDRQVEFLRNSDEVSEEINVIGVVYDLHNVYSGKHGHAHVINLNGQKSPEKVKEELNEAQNRTERIWNY